MFFWYPVEAIFEFNYLCNIGIFDMASYNLAR